jgi:hypothetical protein
VSVEQTRSQMDEAAALERRAAKERLADAQRQEQRAQDARARIDRDYADGALSADNYERLYPKLSAELDGAAAERVQLEQHAAELRSASAEADEVFVGAMTELQEIIARHLADGAGLDEVRFMLHRLFASFVVPDVDGALAFVPQLDPEAVEELTADIVVTKRAALRLTTNANGLPCRYASGPS